MYIQGISRDSIVYETVKRDLISFAKDGEFDLIVHGCNCFCTMSAGIAKAIKSEFPKAYEADIATETGDEGKLGKISWASEIVNGRTLIVVNAYTQFDYQGLGPHLDYEATRMAFRIIKKTFPGLRIGYPAIGAGLAGGNWKIIAKIIEEELDGEDHTFVEFIPAKK